MGEATVGDKNRFDYRIARQTEANIAYFADKLDQIECRLAELDEEWHIERTFQFKAAMIGLVGLVLGLVRRRWLVVPAAMFCCLVRFAVQGWSPGAYLLRRLGLRTMREIEYERHALKTLRGDFASASDQAGESPAEPTGST